MAEGSSKATKTTNNPQDKRSKTVNLPRNLRDEVRKYQEEQNQKKQEEVKKQIDPVYFIKSVEADL